MDLIELCPCSYLSWHEFCQHPIRLTATMVFDDQMEDPAHSFCFGKEPKNGDWQNR